MSYTLLSIAIAIVTVAFVLWLSKQETLWIKAILNWFPAILFAYVIPAIITHLFALDLKAGPIHTFSKDWIIPIAILAVMSALPLNNLK